MDWFSRVGDFPNVTLHAFDWDAWAAAAPPPPPPPPPPRRSPPASVGSSAGRRRAAAAAEPRRRSRSLLRTTGTHVEGRAPMMRDGRPCIGTGCKHGVVRVPLSFGSYVTANLYLPNTTDVPAGGFPVVIFLHGYSYQLGTSSEYGLYEGSKGGLISAIAARRRRLGMGPARDGVAPGDGATKFTARHRDDGASRLGAMVGEIEAALDALHCLAPGVAATLPECADGSSSPYRRAAPRPDGGPPARLLDGLDRRSARRRPAAADRQRRRLRRGGRPSRHAHAAGGGLRWLYETHALLRALGHFDGGGRTPPYDYAELIGAIAPRPALLYSPLRHRFANATAVAAAAEAVAAAA